MICKGICIGALLSALPILMIECTPPHPLQIVTINRITESLFENNEPSSVKGSGEVRIRSKGEESYGNVDVDWQKGIIHATIYSPFGGEAGSIDADSIRGAIQLQKQLYAFDLDQTMDTLPFAWGHKVTFRQFTTYLIGIMPCQTLLLREPDTVFSKKKVILAQWKNDSVEVNATFDRRNSEIIDLQYTFDKSWRLGFSSFKKAKAHKISLTEDEDNYFTIIYDRLDYRK